MARPRIRSTLTAILAVAGLAFGTVVAAGAPAGAATADHDYYLALGDSVAFGYAPPQVTPPQWYQQPYRFRGYADDLAQQVGLNLVNASCPGETTGSFLDVTAPSNGCESAPGSDLGYRDVYPLHTKYTHSQLDFARHFVTTHTDTKLVTINIGANDLFLCQETTPDQCTGSDFLQALTAVGQNVATILGTLRAAGYTGTLVVLGYYSTSYTDPLLVAGTRALNMVLHKDAKHFGATFVNEFPAFQQVAKQAHNDPCAAGLLIRMPDATCNIHPSAYGHVVLAHTIADALSAS